MKQEGPLKSADYFQHTTLKKQVKQLEKELKTQTGKKVTKEFFIEVSDEDIDLLKAYIFFTLASDEVLNFKKVYKMLQILDQKQPQEQYSTLELLKQKFRPKNDKRQIGDNSITYANDLDSKKNNLKTHLGLLRKVVQNKIDLNELLKRIEQSHQFPIILESITGQKAPIITNKAQCVMKLIHGQKNGRSLYTLCVYDLSKQESKIEEREEQELPMEQENELQNQSQVIKKQAPRQSLISEEEQISNMKQEEHFDLEQSIKNNQKNEPQKVDHNSNIPKNTTPKGQGQEEIDWNLIEKSTFRSSDFYSTLFIIFILLALFADLGPRPNFRISQIYNGQYPLLKIGNIIDQKLRELNQ